MSGSLALKSEPAPILACTVSRNIHHFDLLIEDMEAELGDAWGDLSFDEARTFLDQPDAGSLEFLAVTVTVDDEVDLGLIGDLMRAAKEHAVKVLLITEDVSPAALHELLRLGAADFLPYPLADGALRNAIERVRTAEEAAPPPQAQGPDITASASRKAAVFAVHGLAGGTGASTLAANLAWELATIAKKDAPSVCLVDLDLQHATLSTYLDLECREVVVELLQDAQTMDVDAFRQALVTYQDTMSVFTAPPEMIPLDLVGPDEIDTFLSLAEQCFDIIVIDMPHTLVMWTETVLKHADIYFTTLELDMRSAQNAMRFLKALQGEGLPAEKLNFVLNRAPGLTDLNGKGRVKKLAESLGVKIATQLPDGGKHVLQAGDHGQPLVEVAKKNPLRKEIRKLAEGLHKAMVSNATASK